MLATIFSKMTHGKFPIAVVIPPNYETAPKDLF